MLLDIDNTGIAVVTSLSSYRPIQAVIYVIPYPLPVTADIFDVPFILTWESVHSSSTVFMYLKWRFHWKFADTSFVSRDPGYMRYV